MTLYAVVAECIRIIITNVRSAIPPLGGQNPKRKALASLSGRHSLVVSTGSLLSMLAVTW